jgi:hypothetical protein
MAAMSRFLIGILCTAFASAGFAAKVPPQFPITAAQARDVSTLGETVLLDRVLPSKVDAARKIRFVRVKFFSHKWKDGPWWGTMYVALPVKIEPARRGFAVIVPAGTSKKGSEKGFNVRRDFLERTVLELGIPVATMPQQGTHFGETEIHAMSDALTKKFVETRDPAWLAAWPGAAVRSRALTMIGKLTGQPIHSAVHMGSSISAGQGWVWAVCDDRVKGLVATGSMGPFLKIYPLRALRERLKFLHEAPEPVKQLFVKHRDPISFAPHVKTRVLIMAGSNDFATPPALLPEFTAAFPRPPHLVGVPNFPHGCGTRRHADSLRMWVDHTLFARPLCAVKVEKISLANGRLTCTATVTGKPAVKRVTLAWGASANPTFLHSKYSEQGRRNNYTKVKWQFTRMKRTGQKWTATVRLPAGTPPHIAACVDVQENWQTRPGYASTPVRRVISD